MLTTRRECSHLLNKQWNSIKIDNRNLLIKCSFESDKYELILFDLVNFSAFYSQLSDLETKSEELNPKKIIPKEKILTCLQNSLTETKDNCKFEINLENEQRIVLDLDTKINGSVGFKWKFEFDLMDKLAIRDHLVVPLLFNVNEKISRENELLEIIKNKDKLIDDYKSQGVKSNLKHISTDQFILNQFEEVLNKKSEERRGRFFENPEICVTFDSSRKVNDIYLEHFNTRKRKLELEAQKPVDNLDNKKQKTKLKKADSVSESSQKAVQQNAQLEEQLEAERLKIEKKASKAKKPSLKL